MFSCNNHNLGRLQFGVDEKLISAAPLGEFLVQRRKLALNFSSSARPYSNLDPSYPFSVASDKVVWNLKAMCKLGDQSSMVTMLTLMVTIEELPGNPVKLLIVRSIPTMTFGDTSR